MAKILISSIGTGNKVKENDIEKYKETTYQIDDKSYENENFIANALCKHLKIDKLFLIGTKKSIWDAVAEKFGKNKNISSEILKAEKNGNIEKVLPKIDKIIDDNLGTQGSKCFIINYGLNEMELWENFDKFLEIGKVLTPKDEIYLDITHSFRSLSLMSFVMSEFVSNTRNKELNIKGVYYGMLEYARENDGITPVVNLSMFFELLKWSKAIKSLRKYGNSKEILELLEKDNDKNIKSNFKDFSNALSISDIANLQKATQKLDTVIHKFKENQNKIYEYISGDLKKFIKLLNVESLSLLQYRMAKWYHENQNHALAYLTLAEAIVSAVAEDADLNPSNQYDREEAQSIIKEKIEAFRPKKKGDYYTYNEIRNIRNFIAHALDEEGRYSEINPKNAIKNLPKYIENFSFLFKNKR